MKFLTTICLLFFQQVAPAAADTVGRAAEQAVLSAYKRMEEADRKGDGELWFSLRDRKTQDAMNTSLRDAIRKGGRTRPSIRYEPLAIRVANNRAVILGRVADPGGGTVQYDAVLFAVEAGEWKVVREQFSEKPFDQFVLYALLEPDDGPFERQGSPWKTVPYAAVNVQIGRKEDAIWKMQATFDTSFVYLRFESALPIPPAGARVRPDIGKAGKTGGPPPPPPMFIRVSGDREYAISVSSLVSTTETPGPKGKAPSSHYSATYSLFVKNGAGDQVFESTLGDGSTSSVLAVRDHFIDVRIPLAGLGAGFAAELKIELEEADSVLRFLPYHVGPFSPH